MHVKQSGRRHFLKFESLSASSPFPGSTFCQWLRQTLKLDSEENDCSKFKTSTFKMLKASQSVDKYEWQSVF